MDQRMLRWFGVGLRGMESGDRTLEPASGPVSMGRDIDIARALVVRSRRELRRRGYPAGTSSGQFEATVPPSTSKILPVTQPPAGEQR